MPTENWNYKTWSAYSKIDSARTTSLSVPYKNTFSIKEVKQKDTIVIKNKYLNEFKD